MTPSGDFESGCARMPIAVTSESRFRRTAASKIECGGGEDHAAHRVLENVAYRIDTTRIAATTSAAKVIIARVRLRRTIRPVVEEPIRLSGVETVNLVARKVRRSMPPILAASPRSIPSANRRKRQKPSALIDFLGAPGSVFGAHSCHPRLRTCQPKSHR
jgi:hypothetical protein